MCRLAILNPGIAKDEALDILLNMEGCNRDGFGLSYVKDGKIIINKWGLSFSEVLKRKYNPLGFLPHNGWVMVHQRASTHGYVCKNNSHPFIINNEFAWMHNGVFLGRSIFRTIFKKQGIKFNSDTDSEVAGQIFSIIKPRKFNLQMDDSGVYVALNKDGSLDVIKSSGQLEMDIKEDRTILLASDLSYSKYPKSIIAPFGWYKFDKFGRFIHYETQRGQRSNKIPNNNYQVYNNHPGMYPSHFASARKLEMRQERFQNKFGFGEGCFIEHSID